MIPGTMDEFAQIEILISDVGMSLPGRLWQTPIQPWDMVNGVNQGGAVVYWSRV